MERPHVDVEKIVFGGMYHPTVDQQTGQVTLKEKEFEKIGTRSTEIDKLREFTNMPHGEVILVGFPQGNNEVRAIDSGDLIAYLDSLSPESDPELWKMKKGE